MSPLKVLMVNKFHYMRGGSETYHFAVGRALEGVGHEVAWFAMEDPRNLPCGQSSYFVGASDYSGKTSVVQKLKDGLSLVYSFEAKRKFNDLLEAFRPDAIHLNLVHRQLTFSILDAPYLRANRVPVVYTAHDYIPVCPGCTMLDGSGAVCDDCLRGGFSACARKRCVKGSRAKSALAAAEASFLRARGSYRKIDRIIAPSAFMRSKLLEGGFPEGQVVLMRNFAGEGALEQARCAEDGTDRKSPYLLYFGRLSPEKGVGVLVDAFLSAAGELPGWRLVVAGEGPQREALEGRIRSHPTGGRVELVGFKGGPELGRLVAEASLSACPSLCRENMPYSVVESLAAGTPVVASAIGGLPELVREGDTGFACAPGDAGSLSEAILRGASACADAGGYRAMQGRCRRFVLDSCDRETYMSKLVALYGGLAEAKAD